MTVPSHRGWRGPPGETPQPDRALAAPARAGPPALPPWTDRLEGVLRWGALVLAIVAVVLMALPVDFWQRTAYDAIYYGFDPNLVYRASRSSLPGNGHVEIGPQGMRLVALPGSDPLAYPVASGVDYQVALRATIRRAEADTEPLIVGFRQARASLAYLVRFGPPPAYEVTVQALDAAGRRVLKSEALGTYQPDQPYRIAFSIDRRAGLARVSVQGEDAAWQASLTRDEAPGLFLPAPVAFQLSALSRGSGIAISEVTDYELAVPAQDWFAARVRDLRATALSAFVLAGALSLLALQGGLWAWRARGGLLAALRSGLATVRGGQPIVIERWPRLLVAAMALVVAVVANVLLFNLGYHSYDFYGAKLWAYVGARYDVLDIYRLPRFVTPAEIWDGQPLEATPHPYGPVMAYFFTAVGWLYKLFLTEPTSWQGGVWGLPGSVMKGTILLFLLADSLLIYLIARRLGLDVRWAALAAALFLFNPLVWLVSAVWGTTHVVSAFFPLLAMLFILRGDIFPAWLAVGLTCLTRPQLLPVALLLGVVMLRRFPLGRNLIGAAWAVLTVYVLLAPFVLKMSPAFAVDHWLLVLQRQTPTGLGEGPQALLSLYMPNIWVLVSPFTEAVQGSRRVLFPSSAPLIGPLSYALVSTVLSGLVLAALSALVWFRREVAREGQLWVYLVGLGLMSFLLLRTGLANHHMVLLVPLLVLALPVVGLPSLCVGLAIITIGTSALVYGGLAASFVNMVPAQAPLLHPSHNPVAHAFWELRQADWFLTLTAYAHMAVLVWLFWRLARRLWPGPAILDRLMGGALLLGWLPLLLAGPI